MPTLAPVTNSQNHDFNGSDRVQLVPLLRPRFFGLVSALSAVSGKIGTGRGFNGSALIAANFDSCDALVSSLGSQLDTLLPSNLVFFLTVEFQ